MSEILDDLHPERSIKTKRNKLIPIWLRVSCWFFMGLAVVIPIAILYQLANSIENSYSLSIQITPEMINFKGLGILIFVLLMAGITGASILAKKKWALTFAITYTSMTLVIFGYSLIVAFTPALLAIELLLLFFFYYVTSIYKKWVGME